MEEPISCKNEYFYRIIELYSDMVIRLAYLYTKNIHDAEDVTQDVFIKLFKADKKFNDDNHIKAWLITVTKNTSKDYLKSWWTKIRTILRDDVSVTDNYFKSDVIEEVLKLPTKYSEVIYLYYYEGFSTKEISQKLDTKEATIRTRLKRGRSILKSKLGGNWNE